MISNSFLAEIKYFFMGVQNLKKKSYLSCWVDFLLMSQGPVTSPVLMCHYSKQKWIEGAKNLKTLLQQEDITSKQVYNPTNEGQMSQGYV